MAPEALIIPLGDAAQKAVSLLTADGLVSPGRCLTGFPHPSTRNRNRVSQYAANRADLIVQVARRALQQLSDP
jgi:uracil-DNA glycosylase